MLVTKPMMIAPNAKSQDYASFIRNSLGDIDFRNGSFAATMEAEQAATRQHSVSASSLMPPTLAEKKAAEQTKEEGKAESGKPLFNRGSISAIALDQRSLTTLQRLSDTHDTQNNAPASSAAGQGSLRGRVNNNTIPLVAARSHEVEPLGTLSAQYESGSKGIAAIGYDRNGGTSYGKYQISSRQGSFQNFLEYAAKEAPDIAERLSKAGKANTGSKRGAVPEEWKTIAAEQPERFEQLQEGFIRHSHYDPVEDEVKKTLGIDSLSRPMQEVLWSTAVQHGPSGAERLFQRAAQRLTNQGKNPADEKALIEAVYSLRGTQFGSSTPAVQAAVRQRFDSEKRQALAMLREQQQTVIA